MNELGREIGRVGKYAVFHRGPNDYLVVNKNTGTVVSRKRQQSPAWSDAEWLYNASKKAAENRAAAETNPCIYCGEPTTSLICSDRCQREHFGL